MALVDLIKPFIFQVVGFQNSGKTTLVKKLITYFQKRYKVVSVKHHGHPRAPDLNHAKDSSQHVMAGALATIVEGGGFLQLQTNQINMTLDDQLNLLNFFQPELIIIEGHKQESFPKVVIIRSREDLFLLKKLSNINLILYWEKELEEELKDNSLPSYQINDSKSLSFVIEFIENKMNDHCLR